MSVKFKGYHLQSTHSMPLQYYPLARSIQLGLKTVALAASISCAVQAQDFPADGIIELSSLTSLTPDATGLIINGIANGDNTGFATSNAGDINGVGIDDLLIGAYQGNGSGQAFVIFGNTELCDGNLIELSSLNTTDSNIQGLIINGIALADTLACQ